MIELLADTSPAWSTELHDRSFKFRNDPKIDFQSLSHVLIIYRSQVPNQEGTLEHHSKVEGHDVANETEVEVACF